MLQGELIGYLGADAQVRNENGVVFTTFRVAHSERWNDAAGVQHDATQWIDCIMNGDPKVRPFLVKGQLVFVRGHLKTRVYSSEKARGFVAGLTIAVVGIELLGGATDAVPNKLYDAQGHAVDVQKFYHCEICGGQLTNGRGKMFVTDDNGWVVPMAQAPQDVQQVAQEQQQQTQIADVKTEKDSKANKK